MRKQRLLACALAAVLAASAACTSYAEVQNHSDGQQHTVDHDVKNDDPNETAVISEGNGTSVTVNGDVESDGNGVYSWDEGKAEINGDVTSERAAAGSWDTGSSVTVNGDAASKGDYNTVVSNDGGTVSVTGDVVSDADTKSAVVSSNDSTVEVGGSVENRSAVTTGDHVPNTLLVRDDSYVKVDGDVKSTAYGASVSGASQAEVGGSVESELRGVQVSKSSDMTVGGDVNSKTGEGVIATKDSSVSVGGSVNSVGTGVNSIETSDVSVGKDINSETTGIYAVEMSTVSVGGNVSGSTGGDNYNVVYVGDPDTAQDGSKVTVGGDVTSGKGKAVIVNSGSTISVEGSVTSKGDTAVTMSNDSEVEVKKDVTGVDGLVIKETNSQGGGSAVILGTVKADSSGYCITVTGDALKKEDVVSALPTIIVNELSSSNQQYVQYKDETGSGSIDEKETAKAIAEQILYYIDVQETKNGNLSLSGTSKVDGYDVARANDVVTVTVTADNGYELRSVDGGKATAKKNDDGTWSITVPQSGGVSISAIMEAIRTVTGGSGDSDSDSGSNTQTSNNQQNQSGLPAPAEEKAADNSTIKVYGETKGTDQTRSGVVLSDSEAAAGIIDVYTGDAKTAGLPDSVKSEIAAIDGGSLSAVTIPGADLSSMKISGATVALGIRPAGVHDVSVKLYAPDLPAGAVPYVLFFNNYTKTWTLIPATLDPVTGLVEFILPEDGTAAVVYST